MAKVQCGDCGRSFRPGKAPGLAGAAAGAALGAKIGAVVDGLFGLFGGSPAELCPECSAAKRNGHCLSCRWPCAGHCPVCGAMTLL